MSQVYNSKEIEIVELVLLVPFLKIKTMLELRGQTFRETEV